MREFLENIFPDEENWTKTGIYKLYHIDNPERIYLGSAVQTILHSTDSRRIGFYGRLYYHVWSLKNNKHHSPKLQNYINKHGLEGLRIEIIEFCSVDTSKEREEFYIRELDCVKNGFNCSHEGHTNGAKLNQETRDLISKKVSIALKGRMPSNFEESIKGKNAKKILEIVNEEVVNTYPSLINLCTHYGFCNRRMSMYLLGKAKMPTKWIEGSRYWKYA